MVGFGHNTTISRPLSVDPIELIAIDLDGTLLRHDRTIGRESMTAIDEARQQGKIIILATGRAPRGIRKTYRRLKLDTWQVTHNGALIYDSVHHKAIYHRTIDGTLARKVVSLARQAMPRVWIGVEIIDSIYSDCVKRRSDSSQSTIEQAPLSHILQSPVTKIFMTGDSSHLANIQMRVQEKLPGHVGFAVSHSRLLQIVSAGVDKAAALAKIAKHYGIDRNRCMAIGDAPNDLGMMKWSGLSIAVQNAWLDVKNAADFVVKSNDDDGVAEAITKYALN